MRNIVSVSIHKNEIRVAELAVGGKTALVRSLFSIYAEGALPEEHAEGNAGKLAEILRNALSEHGIKTKRAFFTIGSSGILLRRIVLPIMGEPLVRAAVRTNARDYFPVELSGYALACFLPESRNGEDKKFHVTAAAVSENQISFCIKMAKFAGLRLENVSFEVGSLAALLRKREEKSLLVVYLEKDHAALFVSEEGMPAAFRYIEFSESGERCRQMERRAADSIQWMMQSWKEGHEVTPPEAVYIIGQEEQAAIWEREIAGRVSVPVYRCRLAELLKDWSKKPISLDLPDCYSVTVGAALTRSTFVTELRERRLYREKRGRVYRMGILLGLLLSVLIITFPAVRYLRASVKRLELERLLMVSEPVVPVLEQYEEAESKLEDARLLLEVSEAGAKNVFNFLGEIEAVCPESVRITEFSFQEEEIRFSADAPGKTEAAELLGAIRRIPGAGQIELQSLSEYQNGQSGGVRFSLICRLNGEMEEETQE